MALAKEGLSGTLMGCMLGCGVFSFSFLYPGFEPKVALTVAVSLPVSLGMMEEQPQIAKPFRHLRPSPPHARARTLLLTRPRTPLKIISLWANMLGVALPLLAQRLRLNPAVTAAPLMTTIVDATGLLIYFYIAKYVIGDL